MKNIKYKYIGIRGHRGSGKNTIAYLLGNTIQFICDNRLENADEVAGYDHFTTLWRIWCDNIIESEQDALEDMDASKIYLDTFGYNPKFLIELLTDIPHEYFNSDYHKDHVIVNLKDFTWSVDDVTDLKPLSDTNTVIEKVEREGFDNVTIYMTLRDFIVYFATICMKYLGRDIWVKAVRCQENKDKKIQERYGDTYGDSRRFRIFTDIKAPSELTYIKDRGGKIVKVDRPEHKKRRKGVEQLDSDNRFDYEIHNTDIYSKEFMDAVIQVAYDLTYED